MGKNIQQKGFFLLFSFACATISKAQLAFGTISATKDQAEITVNLGYTFEADTELSVYRNTSNDVTSAKLITKIRNGTFVDNVNLKVSLQYYYWFKDVKKKSGFYGGNDYGQIITHATNYIPDSSNMYGSANQNVVTKANATQLALVIGNSVYKHATPSPSAKNDARYMAAYLRKNGWFVAGQEDVSSPAGFKKVIQDFLKEVNPNQTILFYFSGHGIQYNGTNYLLPVQANIQQASDIPNQAFPLDLLQTALVQANCKIQIVLLDACKNNILFGEKSLDGVSSGLNIIENQYIMLNDLYNPAVERKGLIAYATPANAPASDASSGYSPFTRAFLGALNSHPCLDLNQLLEKVRTNFTEKTGSATVPWKTATSLSNEVYLQKCN
jgi:Caspase domain